MPDLLLPPARLPRWTANFSDRHGVTRLDVVGGELIGTADDGSTFRVSLPFDQRYEGVAEVEAFAEAAVAPRRWGVLLVRKGGFAVGYLADTTLLDSKTGQRHVQGRTKAGGQSQQRFARRRDNQARAAFGAAADHAARILGAHRLDALITGGDHAAVEATLTDPRLQQAAEVVSSRWLPTADPRRAVLEQAILDAQALAVVVHNAGE